MAAASGDGCADPLCDQIHESELDSTIVSLLLGMALVGLPTVLIMFGLNRLLVSRYKSNIRQRIAARGGVLDHVARKPLTYRFKGFKQGLDFHVTWVDSLGHHHESDCAIWHSFPILEFFVPGDFELVSDSINRKAESP